METLTVFDFIEDFDNEELPRGEWNEQMEEAVMQYNEDFKTEHDPRRTVNIYLNRKTAKKYGDL